MYPAGVEQAHDERVNEVAELVFEAHGPPVADGETRGVEEIDLKVNEGTGRRWRRDASGEV